MDPARAKIVAEVAVKRMFAEDARKLERMTRWALEQDAPELAHALRKLHVDVEQFGSEARNSVLGAR